MTPIQCRAGRSLLIWTQEVLARKSGASRSAIACFERGFSVPTQKNLDRIRAAMEAEGVIFANGGAVMSRHAPEPTPKPQTGTKRKYVRTKTRTPLEERASNLLRRGFDVPPSKQEDYRVLRRSQIPVAEIKAILRLE